MLKTATVYLNDGTSYQTAVNGQLDNEEIKAYFVGKWFNYGTESDLMKQCVKVEVE